MMKLIFANIFTMIIFYDCDHFSILLFFFLLFFFLLPLHKAHNEPYVSGGTECAKRKLSWSK